MTLRKWVKRIAIGGVVLVAAYFAVGAYLVADISQRHEDWHDEAVANSKPAPNKEWLEMVRQPHPRIELRYRVKPGQLYLIRIYEDQEYISALHPGSSDVPPLHLETGKISGSEWRALRDLAERMYPERESLFRKDDNRNPADLRLTIVHENRQRATYKYHAENFADLPQLLRDYDALLFETMQSWRVKPHHGHARHVEAVTYGVEALPNLLRGLDSPREELHASVSWRWASRRFRN